MSYERRVRWQPKSNRLSGLVAELCVKHPEVESAVSNLEEATFSKHNAQRATAIDVAYKQLEATLGGFTEGKAVAHQLAKHVKKTAEQISHIGNDKLAQGRW